MKIFTIIVLIGLIVLSCDAFLISYQNWRLNKILKIRHNWKLNNDPRYTVYSVSNMKNSSLFPKERGFSMPFKEVLSEILSERGCEINGENNLIEGSTYITFRDNIFRMFIMKGIIMNREKEVIIKTGITVYIKDMSYPINVNTSGIILDYRLKRSYFEATPRQIALLKLIERRVNENNFRNRR